MKKLNHFPIRLYNNVAKFRKLHGLSQATLAERVNITRSNLCKIEYGYVAPSVLTALLLAELLDTSVHELFTLEKMVVLSDEEKFEQEIKKINEETWRKLGILD